jgi:hypothetical protein
LEAAKNKGLTFAWQIELEARTAMSRLKKKKKSNGEENSPHMINPV